MNARTLVQRHGKREVWVNPPPIPLTTEEMDGVFGLPYARVPHPAYGHAKIPAYDMIKTSVNIMRGCFGGCTFCSITEHEGRVIQSRSHESILKELEEIRDKTPGFTGAISDLGGPTANMYMLNCKDPMIHANCRRLSCVFPSICKTSSPIIPLPLACTAKRANCRVLKNRHCLGPALRPGGGGPGICKELVTHHVGGYLKIAPEHTEAGPLNKMMKPGMGPMINLKPCLRNSAKKRVKTVFNSLFYCRASRL